MSWINFKRLQNYPRLILISFWAVLFINVFFHRGWVGFFGGLIGLDYVAHYAGGLLYRLAPNNLYDTYAQMRIIQRLFLPTSFSSEQMVTLFPYPPYVAMVFSLETYLPIAWALVLRTIGSILCGLLSIWFIYKNLIPNQLKSLISPFQSGVLLFSCFPFLVGLFWGQNHLFTLLLVVGICITFIKERWVVAGILAGFLLYKPFFIIGFLILWLVERRWRTLAAFAMTSAAWLSLDLLLSGGGNLYLHFLRFTNLTNLGESQVVLNFDTTLFGFLVPFLPLPANIQPSSIFMAWIILLSLFFLILNWRFQIRGGIDRNLLIALTILSPYLISYHILIYDLVPIYISLIFLARYTNKQSLLYFTIWAYLSPIFLLGLSFFGQLALLALIPLSLIGFIFHEMGLFGNFKSTLSVKLLFTQIKHLLPNKTDYQTE